MNDLISVIIPVYNVERYLKKCIESVINQTYEKLEIILVNDGSTDNSGVICEDLSKKDIRIHVVHKENGGLSDARNTGMKIAKGKYLSFIDSDDFIKEDTIETMYKSLKENECQIAICNMIRFYEDGDEEPFYVPTKKQCVYNGNKRFDTLNQPSVCNKLFLASLFDGISFPKGKYYEDTFVYHEVLYKASKVVLTGQDSYWYLSRKDSILGKPKYTDRYFDFVEAVWKRTSFLLEKNVQPYANEACLSLYAAVSNAEKNIVNTNETKEKFKNMKVWYDVAYRNLMKKSDGTNFKQKIRLVLLKYFPKLHSKIY